MALHTIDPDPALVEVIREALATLLARPNRGDSGLDRLDPRTIALSVPHPVFSVGFAALVDADDPAQALDDARPVAQRFLVGDAAGVVASAEVAAADGSGLAFTEGPYVAETLRALDRAERREDLGEVEIRMLRVPVLHVVTIWLHGLDGQGEQLMPLKPAPLPLETDRFYARPELSRVLVQLAQSRQASLSEPAPGTESGGGDMGGGVPVPPPGAAPRDGTGG